MPDTDSDRLVEPRETAPGLGCAQVILKPRKARPFYSRHPWVLDSAIARIDGSVADGDIVDLVAENGKFVARGVFNGKSRIRVRLYSWNVAEPLDKGFFSRRIEAAIDLRTQLGYDNRAGACRLVFSEGDLLSGLIVDRYADWLAVQFTAQALALRMADVVAELAKRLRPRGIVLRTEKGVARAEGIELRDQVLWGEAPTGPVFIEENSIRYGVDLSEGQKTGFYLDQRENRLTAARYFRGRRVLDMFCYSGGFSLNAIVHGGAIETLGVDSSQKAVALARANAELNGVRAAHFEAADCFEALESLANRGERFGAVLVDPPKFARSRQNVDDALRAYHRLNRMATNVLEVGGYLVTSSCSGHVTREDFLNMLVGVAQQTKRELQILEMRGASPDHPVSATCLESEYLKCFICRLI
jgi:23S rRNA (cytosine1962-C5)-methyltransferase